jgi:hypothetical protein
LSLGEHKVLLFALTNKQKTSPSFGTREVTRGATQIEVAILHKKTVVMTTVLKGQPHSASTPETFPVILFAQITAAAPARNTQQCFSSCGSEIHSAPAHGQCSHRFTALWTAGPARTRSLHSLYCSVVRTFIASFQANVKDEFGEI